MNIVEINDKIEEIHEIAKTHNCQVNEDMAIEEIAEYFLKFDNKCLCNPKKSCPCGQINKLKDKCHCGLFILKEKN